MHEARLIIDSIIISCDMAIVTLEVNYVPTETGDSPGYHSPCHTVKPKDFGCLSAAAVPIN